jgi:hypothetical protein
VDDCEPPLTRTAASFTRGLCRSIFAPAIKTSAMCTHVLHRWHNGDRDGAARNYRRAIGYGSDAAALARSWPSSVFATHPSTGRPEQVPVPLLLSKELSFTRSNLAVLEGMSREPIPGPQFQRTTTAAPSDACPTLVEMLERLDIAAGRVTGAVCDACSTPRQPDAALKTCSRCRLAACVTAPLRASQLPHVEVTCQPTGTAALSASRCTGIYTAACAAPRAPSCRVTL